jgi:3',5'-cyclic AMP phosphodiesterase CpdA
MFTLAHLSDLHLGPLPRGTSWRDFASKRAIGYWSWHLRRYKIHALEIADAMAADIIAHRPDHIALTGDLINIALPEEFVSAAQWLKSFGSPKWITFVPGNHDAYVNVPWEKGAGLWADYMIGDMRMQGVRDNIGIATPFPFVRQRKNIALIGLSSAVPQSLRKAGGRLGTPQIEALAAILADLRTRGYFRAVLIHHPPLPGLASPRKSLADARELKAVIEAEGAELILHGHNHRPTRVDLPTRYGPCHILGASSGSARATKNYPAAAWLLFSIQRQDGDWQTSMTVRVWNDTSRQFETADELAL